MRSRQQAERDVRSLTECRDLNALKEAISPIERTVSEVPAHEHSNRYYRRTTSWRDSPGYKPRLYSLPYCLPYLLKPLDMSAKEGSSLFVAVSILSRGRGPSKNLKYL